MEVIIMKKLTIEKLITKLENIGCCLNDELDHIENNGHSSGMYTKNDLQRIIDWAGSLIRDTGKAMRVETKETTKISLAHIQYLCTYVASACMQIIETIDNEEV